MPWKKLRRASPERAADPVPPPLPAPAALSPGGPVAKKPFQYQFEKDQAAEPSLTVREGEIVGYVAQGKQNLDIALQLGTHERTVEKHMKNIRAKLKAETRTEVAAWYYEEKLRASEARIAALEAENNALKTRLCELVG